MKNTIFVMLLGIFLTGCVSTVHQTQVIPGMNRKTVKLAWGTPQKVKNTKNSCCMLASDEAWYYFSAKFQKHSQPKYVLFKDNRVEEVFVWKK